MSDKVAKILQQYKDNEGIPNEEIDKIIDIMTRDFDNLTGSAVKEDLGSLLKPQERKLIGQSALEEILTNAKQSIGARSTTGERATELLIPSTENLFQLSKT